MNRKLFVAIITIIASFTNVPSYSRQITPQMEIEAPAISFTDVEGNVKNIKDFRGKTVVLSFWATWCMPCLVELPALDRLQAKMGDKVLILPVALESKGTNLIKRFYERADIQHLPIYVDQSHISQSIYQLRALPMTFVINSNGMLVGKVEGAMQWNTKEIQQYLENL